jgi:hypothetical protein
MRTASQSCWHISAWIDVGKLFIFSSGVNCHWPSCLLLEISKNVNAFETLRNSHVDSLSETAAYLSKI